MTPIAWSSRLGRHAVRRFRNEAVIWLTTVDRRGRPQPRPVWFSWEGGRFHIYSQPAGRKLVHLRGNPRVALSLNSDPDGNDVVVILGIARVLRSGPAAHPRPAYLRKYREAIASLGSTPQEFGAEYSVAIQVTPLSLRGF